MSTIEEKRVYGKGETPTDVYVASATGVVRVTVADDLVGEFSLCVRHSTRDVAAGGGLVVAATAEDVLVTDADSDPESFAETGFGPAVAVGSRRGIPLAADGDGRLARYVDDEWHSVGHVSGSVTAIDGDLVGTDGGLFRVRDDDLDPAGLDAIQDVSTAAVPLAATADGLYRLGNGWMRVLDGSTDTVDADPAGEPDRLGRAHAAADRTVFEHDDGAWVERDRTDEPVVGFAYGETAYAVTTDGVFLAATADGWRSRRLGVTGVVGVACPTS